MGTASSFKIAFGSAGLPAGSAPGERIDPQVIPGRRAPAAQREQRTGEIVSPWATRPARTHSVAMAWTAKLR